MDDLVASLFLAYGNGENCTITKTGKVISSFTIFKIYFIDNFTSSKNKH